MWRKVISADLDEGGQRSAFKEWVTLGCQWTLSLDCGHTAYRSPRYIKKPLRKGGYHGNRRKPEDALPAPKRVKCQQCNHEVSSVRA